ncbi:ribonuclease H2, subunit B [Amylostereum chailletii]|nr:ribonuclease H2, subunit B [Amylostereum chailletii]
MTTHIGILPIDVMDTITMKIQANDVSNDTSALQFLRLPHPRTSASTLFLPHVISSTSSSKYKWRVLEVQSISPPNPRSWFLNEGEVIADGKMLIMTPIDPTFLLLPLLLAAKPADGSAGLFQPLDDIFDGLEPKLNTKLPENGSPSVTQEDISILASLDCVAGAMRRICDVQDIAPEITVYRWSEDKAIEYLQSKVARLSTQAVCEISRTITRSLAKDGLMDDGKEQVLQRTFHSIDLHAALLAKYDFAALDAHMQLLQDEFAAQVAANAPKERTKAETSMAEDGKKRKAKASQGVEKLKKVNVSGMAKISSFFQKK